MDRTIGLLGGGQLGQMLCEAAGPLGVKIIVLDAENSPAKQVNARNAHVNGSFTDPDKIRELARQCDILTVEIEHIDTHVLEEIAEQGVEVVVDGKSCRRKVEVQPNWRTLRMIQDKYLQKQHLIEHGVAVTESIAVESTVEALKDVGDKLGYPFMLKARKDSYDGRGNFPVKSPSHIEEALKVLKDRALYAEKWARFKMELAVMVVKAANHPNKYYSTSAYPAVETIQEDSICKLVYAPARGVHHDTRKRAQELARKAVASLWGKGVFGVELFLMEDDSLLLSEMAPRPHNSAHYTIEACPTMSQYKAQLLSILGYPVMEENIPMAVPAAIMLNILGGANTTSHNDIIDAALLKPNAALHMYGKEPKPGRKIGHITIINETMELAESSMSDLITLVDTVRAERKSSQPPQPKSIIQNPTRARQPLVAITMGSDSDLPILKPGLALLASLQIPYFVTITSAHRTPTLMSSFATTAASKGFRVIIAAAGGAAHLPGMIAAMTSLPVIGVPVRGSTLDGMDSLLSIVQMPRGVPVATVAINNSVNAALLAARILGTTDGEIKARVEGYAREMEREVLAKGERLGFVGWEGYPGAKEGPEGGTKTEKVKA